MNDEIKTAEPRYISIVEAANYLGLSRQSVYLKVKKGEIKAYRPSGDIKKRAYKFKYADLDDFMGNAN